METLRATPSPGQRIRVIQEAQARAATWRTTVEGVVVACESQPTGSWHAHGRGGRLWLQRLRLRKDDGELVDLVLDAGSSVTVLADASGGR